MADRLKGRVAIVTGGTSGIGERTAVRFVEEGASVVIAGRSEEKGRAIAARLGSRALFCRADVTHEADIVAMVEAAKKNFGRVDCLFNNAGLSTAGRTAEEVTEEAFVYDMKVLVGSVILGVKHVLPHMRAQGSGSIINNASIAGILAGFGPIVYSAAKAAVIQLTRTMAMDLTKTGIRVNAISPGAIETPIFGRALGFSDKKADETLTQVGAVLSEVVPIGRVGTPDDIASAAVFLASDESSFMTGHNLVVDGAATIGQTPDRHMQLIQKLHSLGKS
jgi:NAD(P)-dependent dehydrogenase (short-subunit alcohol dehydrogenase family)